MRGYLRKLTFAIAAAVHSALRRRGRPTAETVPTASMNGSPHSSRSRFGTGFPLRSPMRLSTEWSTSPRSRPMIAARDWAEFRRLLRQACLPRLDQEGQDDDACLCRTVSEDRAALWSPRPGLGGDLGLETGYGGDLGGYPTFSALATLAYDCRRSQIYRAELVDAMMLVQRGLLRPEQMRGAWAGEIGQTQFMPSAYLKYAVNVEGGGGGNLMSSSRRIGVDGQFSARPRLAAGGRLGRRPAELRRPARMELGPGLREDDCIARRQAEGTMRPKGRPLTARQSRRAMAAAAELGYGLADRA